MSHRRIAVYTILAAIVLDAALGLAFAKAQRIPPAHGLFCGLANAVTDGCDVAPKTTAAYVITAMQYSLVVPLFGATFSLFTSGLAGLHVGRSEGRIMEHIEDRLRRHLGPMRQAP